MTLAHPFVWILLALFVDAFCALTLSIVAEARGESRWFALWGLFGFAGLLAGLLIMFSAPSRPTLSNPPR